MSIPSDAPESMPQPPRPTALPDEAYYQRGDQARRWGGLLVLFGVIWLVFSLTTRGLPFDLGFGFVEATQTAPVQRYTAQQVVISGTSDEVYLSRTTADQIEVEVVTRGFGWQPSAAEASRERLEVRVEVQDDTLQIEVRRPPSIGVVLGRAPYAELYIALPANVAVQTTLVSGSITGEELANSLDLRTISGDMRLNASSGPVILTTTSGEMTVHDHSGSVEIESVSGDLELRHTDTPTTLRIETVSGDAELEQVRGAVEFRSISGDLELKASGPTSLQLETTSGDLDSELMLAPNSTNQIRSISGDVQVALRDPNNLSLTLNSSSGDLEIDLASRERTDERRSVQLTLGTGSTSLEISTTSGDIRVTEP